MVEWQWVGIKPSGLTLSLEGFWGHWSPWILLQGTFLRELLLTQVMGILLLVGLWFLPRYPQNSCRLAPCFSNFDADMNHLWIWLQCRFWPWRSGVGLSSWLLCGKWAGRGGEFNLGVDRLLQHTYWGLSTPWCLGSPPGSLCPPANMLLSRVVLLHSVCASGWGPVTSANVSSSIYLLSLPRSHGYEWPFLNIGK